MKNSLPNLFSFFPSCLRGCPVPSSYYFLPAFLSCFSPILVFIFVPFPTFLFALCLLPCVPFMFLSPYSVFFCLFSSCLLASLYLLFFSFSCFLKLFSVSSQPIFSLSSCLLCLCLCPPFHPAKCSQFLACLVPCVCW